MKTVRYNTYETNSSSTHAYTVNAVNKNNRPDLNIIPREDGCIYVSFTEASEAVPQEKIGHLLKYANHIGDQEMFDRVRKVVEEFTGATLKVSGSAYVDGKWVKNEDWRVVSKPKFDFNDEDADWESISDEWYSYTCEYGHDGAEDFCNVMNEIGRTEENIKIFIFSSNQGFHVESYYN